MHNSGIWEDDVHVAALNLGQRHLNSTKNVIGAKLWLEDSETECLERCSPIIHK